MSRKIKVRVWSKPMKRFLTKDEWFFDFDGSLYFWDIIENNLISVREVEYVVQQYTELLDKNGVEIYEGDIIEFERQEGVWADQVGRLLVKYPFVCGNADLGSVVGNIFQNSELVK